MFKITWAHLYIIKMCKIYCCYLHLLEAYLYELISSYVNSLLNVLFNLKV